MQNNANRIVIAAAVALVAVVLVLMMGSGLNGGGGGGGSTPNTTVTTDQNQQQDSDAQGFTDSNVQVTSEATGTSSGNDMTIDELENLIAQQSVPAGQNARDAASSPNVPAANSVYQEVAQRGFEDAEVLADFDLGGTYEDPHTLDESSTEKYPSYSMIYQSEQGVVWVVYVNDGSYIAVPLGGDNGALAKEIIVVEDDSVVQYDGTKNEFSDQPISSITDAVVIQVNRVDKATLDSYTATQLEAM